jgi:hypothetical protein
VIDHYRYAGIDFYEDLKLVLPEGEEWDRDIGKYDAFLFEKVHLFFHMYMIF